MPNELNQLELFKRRSGAFIRYFGPRKIPSLTLYRASVLDSIQLLGERPVAEARKLHYLDRPLDTRVLRWLLDQRCIEVVSLAPARYRVTRLGAAARSAFR